jgi:NTP pyrophosphatase (non-canonical NTP hydrolase)
MNNRQEKPPLKCLLGIDPEKAQKCKPSECASCGWEAAEAARRREYVKEHGLTLCADGFRRLIIKKENDMATPYKECPHCGAHLDSGEKCDCRAAGNPVALENVVDLERQTRENNKAMNRVLDFIAPRKMKERVKTMTGINEVAKEIHENAVAHGWWDEERGFPEVLALIHSEVSEALEEYRNGHGATEIYFSDSGKPEGIPTELADVIIRVLDYCGYAGINIDAAISQKHEYNKSRPYRHGGKKC